jgi:hypothetical protein
LGDVVFREDEVVFAKAKDGFPVFVGDGNGLDNETDADGDRLVLGEGRNAKQEK